MIAKILLVLTFVMLIVPYAAIGQARSAKNSSTTTRRNYGDTYATFNNRGEMIGVFSRDICSSVECSQNIAKTGTITGVHDNAEVFRIKYTNGKSEEWPALADSFSGLWSSSDRNLIASLIHVGKRITIATCGCGVGHITRLASISVVFSSSTLSQTQQTNQNANWAAFWSAFRAGVNRSDRGALSQMMASQFDWATDGYISREEAIENIRKIIGWKRFWLAAKRAVATKPSACDFTLINHHSGYCVSAHAPFPLQLVFELGHDGTSHWSALPGD